MNVQWIRADGQPLPFRASTDVENTLTIVNLEATDAGRYICIADNAYGRSQEEVELTVQGVFCWEMLTVYGSFTTDVQRT